MSGKNTAVFGIFRDLSHVETGVEALRDNGFREVDISVLVADNKGTKDFAVEKHTKAPEGLSTGASAGAIIGGALAVLASIGTISIPELGPFLIAGPIVSVLAGIGTGGIAGGIIGGLIGMGMPEYEAKRYEGLIKEGRALLSVHCDNAEWVKRAKDVLSRMGAEDISAAGEAGAQFATADQPKVRHGGA
jgi:hypothetical protein